MPIKLTSTPKHSKRTAEYWIENLGLQKHPEGGYFKEIYRSDEKVKKEHLDNRFSGDRCYSTSIYYLLKGNEVNKKHRVKSDETWHFYDGSAITLHLSDEYGYKKDFKLGMDFEKGELLQFTIRRYTWFYATVDNKDSYALAGCTVAPGFEYDDMEMG